MRDEIDAALKAAVLAQDRRRTTTLRLIKSAIKDRDIAARGSGGGNPVADDEIVAILGRMIRQRRESAKMYEDGGRPELASEEIAEIAIIDEFLPRQLDEAETAKAISDAVAEVGATSPRDMGKVMATLRARYAGSMDFGRASQLLKTRLQGS